MTYDNLFRLQIISLTLNVCEHEVVFLLMKEIFLEKEEEEA